MTANPAFCAVCGRELGADHSGCVAPLEPPRYCPNCRRRMVVQVLPTGWRARCVEHGELIGGVGSAAPSS